MFETKLYEIFMFGTQTFYEIANDNAYIANLTKAEIALAATLYTHFPDNPWTKLEIVFSHKAHDIFHHCLIRRFPARQFQ